MPSDILSSSSISIPKVNTTEGEGAARDSRIVAVIDDDAAVCDSTRILLEALDYEVHTYPNAAEFFAAHPKLSCLIVDYHMPEMNGLEVIAEIRKRGNLIPVIMITAVSDPRIEARAAELGIRSLLKKPLGKALVTALQNELG